MRPPLKSVIFDIDGTMIPNTPFHAQAFIDLGQKYEINVTQEDYRRRFHARSNQEIIQDMFGGQLTSTDLQRIAQEKETIYRALYKQHFQEVAGLTKLIENLIANGITCAAASNGPRENVIMAMELLNLNNKLKFALAFEDVQNGKPAPDLFLKAAAQLNSDPRNCLVFEDSKHGFQAARAAGMAFIAVDSDEYERASVNAPDALHIVIDYQELSFEKLQEIF